MGNNNLDYNIEWGILIHQLPKVFMGKAIRILPRDIQHTFIDKSGMRVYFCRKEICDEFIRKKCLDLDGILFNIFSTVTCLTIFGIAPVASKEIIQTYLKAKDMRVLDLYQILETNHYRIILDVPEVLANIELNPILLDASYGSGFPMEFYCRVCCREGHKQYQCQQISTENHGEVDKRNKCVDTCSKIKRNSKQGSFVMPSCLGMRNTRSRSEGIQKSPNLPSRQNADLIFASPSTSGTPTIAENLMRRNRNLTARKNEGLIWRILLRSPKNTTRTSRNKYPSRGMIKSIMDTKGILSSKHLLKCLKLVYKNKEFIEYAKKYAPDIPAVIQQIRSVISHYNQRNPRDSLADRDIKILEDLCKRLDASDSSDTESTRTVSNSQESSSPVPLNDRSDEPVDEYAFKNVYNGIESTLRYIVLRFFIKKTPLLDVWHTGVSQDFLPFINIDPVALQNSVTIDDTDF